MNKLILISNLQRFSGLIAFVLLTLQIVIGSNMAFFRKKIGSLPLKLHMTNGLLTYFFVLLHPLIFIYKNYLTSGSIDPFFPFIDVCFLCQHPIDYYYNFGRLAFWLVSVAVLAGFFRARKEIKKNWRWFHRLNYIAFYFVSIHIYFLGVYLQRPTIKNIFWVVQILMAIVVVKKLKNLKLKEEISKFLARQSGV